MRVRVLLSTCLMTSCVDSTAADLAERIDDAVRRITADTCFAQADTSACAWADYEVGPAHFNMAVSTGESILVVDSFGAQPCVYQDPIVHRQLEVYRQRYR
jgi:hypothetical protein